MANDWIEEGGEVSLIGGWAHVALSPAFRATVDTSSYHVLLTSYDAVLVFVQNRGPEGFEIHVAPAIGRARARIARCVYRVVGRHRRNASKADSDGRKRADESSPKTSAA